MSHFESRDFNLQEELVVCFHFVAATRGAFEEARKDFVKVYGAPYRLLRVLVPM